MDSQTTPPPFPTSVLCSNCHKSVPMSDTITLQNAPVCAACKPIVLQRLREGVAPIPSGIWRDEKTLVAEKDAILPDRCVKCNAPANGFLLKRPLRWHPSGYYLLIIFPGLLIYALIALAISKKATLQVGLCPTHVSKRKNAMLIAWGLFLGSILSFLVSSALNSGWCVLIGFLLLLAAPIYGGFACRVIAPKRIDGTHAWVTGVCDEYLNSLPRWQ